MFISKLIIEDFKNISAAKVENFNTIKAIIGINTSGKSSLLSFISLFSASVNKSFARYLNFYNKSSLDMLPFFDIKKPVKAKFTFSKKFAHKTEELYDYVVQIKYLNSKEFTVEVENIIDLKTQEIVNYGGTNTIQQSSSLKICGENSVEHEIKSYLANIAYYNSYDKSLLWFPNIVGFNCKVNTNDSNTKNMFLLFGELKKQTPNIYKEIIQIVKQYNPTVVDIKLDEERGEILVSHSYSKKYISFGYMSDGFIRFVNLLIMLKLPKQLRPKLLLLEEPEIGLNPFLVDLMGDLISSYSQSSQVIFITHSPLLINKLAVEEIRVLSITHESGVLELNSIDKTKVAGWLDQNYKLGDLWLMNIIGASIV